MDTTIPFETPVVSSIFTNDTKKKKVIAFLKRWGKDFSKFIMMDAISCILYFMLMFWGASYFGWIAAIV